MDSKLPAGAVRKDIYKSIEFVAGRELTESEHKQFKALITHYAVEYGQEIASSRTPESPTEHTFICGGCGGRKVGIGKSFKDAIKKFHLDPEKLSEVDRQRVKVIYEALNLGA